MALPVTYSTGLVSVENGSTTVTMIGGFWGDDNIMPGDLFCDPAQPLVPPQRIASVAYDDVEEVWTAELWADWPGTTMEDADYEVRYVGIIERSTAQSRRVLEQLGDVKAWYDVVVEDDAARLALDTSGNPLRAGYRVLVREDGVIWAKKTSAYDDWIGPVVFKGDTGEKGWSPQMVIASDGDRRVWQLDGYVGGEGDAPTANVGDYLKADGTWTSTIGDAADVRGPAGADGQDGADGELAGDLGATDDAILRADGTGGTTAQGSTATLSDAGLMSTAGFVSTRAKSDTEGPGSNAGEFIGKDNKWATRTGTDDSFNLDVSTGGNAIKVKAGGQVLKPKTPRFNAVLNASFYPNTSTLTAFGGAWSSTVRVNVGSHFVPSTGRFTAPVAGDYRFSVTAGGYLAASGLQLWLYRNGSAITGGGCYMEVANGVWTTAGMEILISLSASDYVELYGYSYNAGNFLSAAYTNFIGELVG